ncbi:hypothetical protein BASA61_007237 [Batrachochytrium salamandrivorans]|nr:hypothetical protein BASA61_007237 [Batrachochytrium salamandrivorans]
MSGGISNIDKRPPWRTVDKRLNSTSTTVTSLDRGPEATRVRGAQSQSEMLAEALRVEVFGTMQDKQPTSMSIRDKYQVSARINKIGNRAVRGKILREFVSSNDKKTGPQIEKEFSNGASLFLTRISAWLRLTYLLSYDLALQLRAITIFVSASSGSRFLSEFLEVGGILTVLEILTLTQAKEEDKSEALRLLQRVANNGRKYKEFICESFGVRQVTECLSKSRSEITQDYARNLLSELGMGNPKFQMQVFKGLQSLFTSQAVSPTAQQMSGQALRTLLPSIPSVPAGFIDPTLRLLKSPHIQVQYEGYEILKELFTRQELHDSLLKQLISILHNVVDDKNDEINDDRYRRNKSDQKGLVSQWSEASAEEQKSKDQIMSGYIQQAYVAKLLGLMSATSRELAERMIQLQLVGSLLNVIANVGHPESQRYAANTLIYIVGDFDYVGSALRGQMGSNFFELLENRPDTFYRELTKEQVRYLRRNVFKIKRANSMRSLSGSGSGTESSDEDSGQNMGGQHAGYVKKDIPSFPFSNDPKESKPSSETTAALQYDTKTLKEAAINIYEKENTEEISAPQVESLYSPQFQTNSKSTFAGHKYVVSVSPNEGAKKFSTELEKFKSSTFTNKKREGKKEFNVVYQPEMQARLSNMKADQKLFSKDMTIDDGTDRRHVPISKEKPTARSTGIPRGSSLTPISTHIQNNEMDDYLAEDLDTDGISPDGSDQEIQLNELDNGQENIHSDAPQLVINYAAGNTSYHASASSDATDDDDEVFGEEKDYCVSIGSMDRLEIQVDNGVNEEMPDDLDSLANPQDQSEQIIDQSEQIIDQSDKIIDQSDQILDQSDQIIDQGVPILKITQDEAQHINEATE